MQPAVATKRTVSVQLSVCVCHCASQPTHSWFVVLPVTAALTVSVAQRTLEMATRVMYQDSVAGVLRLARATMFQ